MKKAKITYWLVLLFAIVVAVALEFTVEFDGIVEQQSMTEVMTQYISILCTLLLIYLALKLVRKNPYLRIAMLAIPMIANVFMYHIFSLTASFGYLSVMCLLAYAFVYPSEKEDNTDADKPNDNTAEE